MAALKGLGRVAAMGLRSANASTATRQISTSILRASKVTLNNSLQQSQRLMATSVSSMARKSDSDLGEFLTEEIAAEKANKKPMNEIAGFQVKKESAELTLTKTEGDEKIVVSLNVNHTVDSAEPDDGSQEAPEMKSMPNFEVDIVKSNGKTLSFSCSYIQGDMMDQAQGGGEEQMDDSFTIDEVTMFEGEDWSEKKYAVAGDILDGYLYDLFMNMLEERGINKAFADQLSDYCSAHEHSLYINMLEDLQKFVK